MSDQKYITIVTSIQIPADDITEGYRKLCEFMNQNPDFVFDTTEEWYDEEGMPVDLECQQEVIHEVWFRKPSDEG